MLERMKIRTVLGEYWLAASWIATSEVALLASALGIVSSEAADASRLAWAATNPGVDSEPIQYALLGYLQAVRAHEWNGITAATGADPATTHAIASLESAVRTQAARPTLGTPASTELLASLDALTSDRRARLAAASHQLPALFVAVLLLTGVALIVNATALTLRSGRRTALLVGGLAAVVGLSLALLFALGTPWRGPITVSGQPIDAVVRDLNIGYFHPLSRHGQARARPGGARRSRPGRPHRVVRQAQCPPGTVMPDDRRGNLLQSAHHQLMARHALQRRPIRRCRPGRGGGRVPGHGG